MQTEKKSRVRRIIAWLRETWDEVDYAQRRMVELQQGIGPRRVSTTRSDVGDLEALYRLPARDPHHGLE
jgi:hypothetical protein